VRGRRRALTVGAVYERLFGTCSLGIWTGTVLAAFLYLLSGGSNSAVGYIEAIQGVATLITALPVGYIADKFGRSSVIRAERGHRVTPQRSPCKYPSRRISVLLVVRPP
jgi:MFS family permease